MDNLNVIAIDENTDLGPEIKPLATLDEVWELPTNGNEFGIKVFDRIVTATDTRWTRGEKQSVLIDRVAVPLPALVAVLRAAGFTVEPPDGVDVEPIHYEVDGTDLHYRYRSPRA